MFTTVWAIIQPLLDERTRNKIDILGSNYLQAIEKHIDLSQIEEQFGGSHERYPIPDRIVQVAIDNEERLLQAQQEEIPIASMVDGTSPVLLDVSSSGDTLGSKRLLLSKRERIRKLFWKMRGQPSDMDDEDDSKLNQVQVIDLETSRPVQPSPQSKQKLEYDQLVARVDLLERTLHVKTSALTFQLQLVTGALTLALVAILKILYFE